MYVLANLDNDKLGTLQSFEEEAGLRVLALSHVEVEPAPIDAEALDGLRRLEEELGVCLVAVQ